MWLEEVSEIRDRIKLMRSCFVDGLKKRGVQRDFSFVTEHNGMFSLLGLNIEQIKRLRDEFSIYLLHSSRVNVAGMTSKNMDYLCDAMAAVLVDSV